MDWDIDQSALKMDVPPSNMEILTGRLTIMTRAFAKILSTKIEECYVI